MADSESRARVVVWITVAGRFFPVSFGQSRSLSGPGSTFSSSQRPPGCATASSSWAGLRHRGQMQLHHLLRGGASCPVDLQGAFLHMRGLRGFLNFRNEKCVVLSGQAQASSLVLLSGSVCYHSVSSLMGESASPCLFQLLIPPTSLGSWPPPCIFMQWSISLVFIFKLCFDHNQERFFTFKHLHPKLLFFLICNIKYSYISGD